MKLDELDYDLPADRVAQYPSQRREDARLLFAAGDGGEGFIDARVRDLVDLVSPALWVVNDTKVMRARLRGQKPTGGTVEVLLVEPIELVSASEQVWRGLGQTSRGLREGQRLVLDGESFVADVERAEAGEVTVRLRAPEGVSRAIHRCGEVPLPPYVRRDQSPEDARRYQTVFAAQLGSVAAPTAGLHFSHELMALMRRRGHRFCRVTLHVGPGTFSPVRVDDLDDHPMHRERFAIPEATVDAIAQARGEGMDVVAVGTTVVRTLESVAGEHGEVRAGVGSTDLLIQPPFSFRVVDRLLTNFHLPRSTLLALVMAFAGRALIRDAYAHAVRGDYRFYSYGDAMLLGRADAV